MQPEQLLPLIGVLFLLSFLFRSHRKRSRHRKRTKARTIDQNQKFPRNELNGRVIRITDGDGLIANVTGFGRLNIRLAHIDAPEYNQPWGDGSKKALIQLLDRADAQFRLLYRDRYARAVAVVWVGNTVINEEMVRLGHAWMYERYIPSSYRPHYQALMEKAKQSKSGLWEVESTPIPPWEWRQKTTKTTTSTGFLGVIILLAILFLFLTILRQ